jgi:tetratricopeptide (TPR) repeat protein
MAQGAAMIGQLLDRRYRIKKVLGSNGFSKTYLAVDTHRPGEPKCVVKELRLPRTQGKSRDMIELIFKKKVEFLEKIGKHDQVPQLLAFFQANQEFYLVEEFIIGHPLSDEIGHGIPIPEDQICKLLHEILEILIFVHGHGIIHRQVRAENLIRRNQDGQLVLINFSPVKEITINFQLLNAQRKAAKSGGQNLEGELALEFAQTQSYNTDIYGAGLIAIEAITGLPAKDLMEISDDQNPENPILEWHAQVKVRPQLVSLLDKMVHPDPSERFQSAPEVLAALKKLKPRSSPPQKGSPPVPPPPPPVKPMMVPPTQIELEDSPELKTQPMIPSWAKLAAPIAAGLILLVIGSVWMLYNQSYKNQRVEELKSSAQERAESGDQQAAIQHYTQAITLKPTGETYYQRANAQFDLGNYQAAIEDYTAALAKDANYVAAYFNRGLAYLQLNQFKAAIDDYTKVIEINAKDADAYYQRGLAYHGLKDYSGAIADYTKVIQLSPNDATAFINRGLSYSASGDKQKAIADLTQALRINPNNAQAYYSRGRARFFLADYQGAMEDYTDALRINPEDADTYVNRCGAYMNLAKYDEAIADCNQAIELNPQDPAAYSNRCLAYTNLQQYPEAITDCTRAIQLEPDSGKAYSNRGMARAAAGDAQGAIEDYTEAIRLVPNDAVAYSNRGTVYYELGKYPEGLLDYTQAIQFKPDYDIAYYKRGLIRVQLQDKIGAIADFQKAGKLCLDRGRTGCYHDAQYQIDLLQNKP